MGCFLSDFPEIILENRGQAPGGEQVSVHAADFNGERDVQGPGWYRHAEDLCQSRSMTVTITQDNQLRKSRFTLLTGLGVQSMNHLCLW